MEIERTLSSALVETHPEEAAAVLESLDPGEAAELLAGESPSRAAGALARVSPHAAAEIVQLLGPARAVGALQRLDPDLVASILRRLPEASREALLHALPDESARPVRRLLRFPAGSAGALMDPSVLALTQDLSAEEALGRVRRAPARVLYNLYVVDRSHVLVGVLNLRELLLARPDAPLSAVMRNDVQRVPADADRHAVAGHPGWREVHSLPVVDEAGRFLGALRYRTLRRLEAELRGPEAAAGAPPTASALGDLFWTGVAGLIETVAGPGPAPSRG